MQSSGTHAVFKHEGVKLGGCATETILLDTEPCDYHIGCAAMDADSKKNQHPSQSSGSTSSSSSRAEISHQQNKTKANGIPKFMTMIYLLYRKITTADVCDVSRMKERSAKRNKSKQLDARIKATRFAEHVYIDTLFLKEGSDGKLLSHSAETKLKLQVFRDEKTGDIAAYPVANRKTKTMRNVMIEFGGHRSAISTMTSDRAPELLAAGSSLGIAVFKSTPGRSSSNSKAERSNETCLEWGRHDFERGRMRNYVGRARNRARVDAQAMPRSKWANQHLRDQARPERKETSTLPAYGARLLQADKRSARCRQDFLPWARWRPRRLLVPTRWRLERRLQGRRLARFRRWVRPHQSKDLDYENHFLPERTTNFSHC